MKLTAYQEKLAVNILIRLRMNFLYDVAKNEHHRFSAFTQSDARHSLKKLKKRYPYCWKTRKKKVTVKGIIQ